MPKIYIPVAMQRTVIQRANGFCEYCLLPAAFSPNPFNFEHIIPLFQDGETVLTNLAYSCGGCNSFKHQKIEALDPLTRQIVPLFYPRIDIWSDHFQWNEDDLQIIGISPVGRATARLLKVNREGNINLRALLKLAGLHPPNLPLSVA
jgi:HNH endonuclease